MRQLPVVVFGERVCVCSRPEPQRVIWRSLCLLVCLACEGAILSERKVVQ